MDHISVLERNLVIIHRGPEYVPDFAEIAGKICAIDPSIVVFCVGPKTTRAMPDEDWKRPTLTVALFSNFKADIRRGPILMNRAIHKLGQYRAFIEAGLPTPPTLRFTPGMRLDPIMFGEYVVIKPTDPDLASYGRGIQLFRRRKLETMTIADFPRDHLIHRDRSGFIVQRYIDTGPLLPLYRVVTLFGTPLYMWLGREKVPEPPLGETDEEIERHRITSNTGNFREILLGIDEEVLALASRVGEALPDVPALGSDITRDVKSGKLYVLECNPGGNTWHFSSKLTAGVRQRIGGASLVGAKKAEQIGRRMLIDQLGAFDRAAEVLVRKVRELAR
jgi:hypothetical protein